MTIETQPNVQEIPATEAKTIVDPELSFSDYEKLRRGEKLPGNESKSAPIEKSVEQKDTTDSDSEETEESEEQESSENSETDSEKDKPKKKGGFQRRIDKLNSKVSESVRRAEEKEKEVEYWKKEALKTKDPEQSKAGKVETKVEPTGKPNPDDFDTHAEWAEALTDWKIEQRDKIKEAETQKSALKSEQDKVLSSHRDRVIAFKEKAKDWDEVMSDVSDVMVSPAVQEVFTTSDLGPELMYELAKNVKELDRICKLSPLAAARELGKLERKIELKLTPQDSEKKPEPPKITKAPKPIEPVGSSKGPVAKSIDDPNISFSEYERIRREQKKRRA